jgi:hypothetical protein
MPFKDPVVLRAKHKEYSARYYQRNKESEKIRLSKKRAENKKQWLEYKTSLACTKCGAKHPAILDFHHPPGTKKFGVNELATDGRYAMAFKESQKCIVLCSNCHRIHHYNERLERKNPPAITPGGKPLGES